MSISFPHKYSISHGSLSASSAADLGDPHFVLAFKVADPDTEQSPVELTILVSDKLDYDETSAFLVDSSPGPLLPAPKKLPAVPKPKLLKLIQPDGSVVLGLNLGIWRWFP